MAQHSQAIRLEIREPLTQPVQPPADPPEVSGAQNIDRTIEAALPQTLDGTFEPRDRAHQPTPEEQRKDQAADNRRRHLPAQQYAVVLQFDKEITVVHLHRASPLQGEQFVQRAQSRERIAHPFSVSRLAQHRNEVVGGATP